MRMVSALPLRAKATQLQKAMPTKGAIGAGQSALWCASRRSLSQMALASGGKEHIAQKYQ